MFEHQLDRLAVRRVEDELAAWERLRHRAHERFDLRREEIVEHARGEHCAPPLASISLNHEVSFKLQGMFFSRSPAGRSASRTAMTSGKSRL